MPLRHLLDMHGDLGKAKDCSENTYPQHFGNNIKRQTRPVLLRKVSESKRKGHEDLLGILATRAG